MKYIYLLLLFICSWATGQQIPSKVNTIAIKGVTFSQVSEALVEGGYFIEAKDSGLMTIRTVPRHYSAVLQTESTYIIYIRIKDGIAYLTGTYVGPESNAIPVFNHAGANGKTKKSLPGVAFILMNNFALSLKRPVEYLIQ